MTWSAILNRTFKKCCCFSTEGEKLKNSFSSGPVYRTYIQLRTRSTDSMLWWRCWSDAWGRLWYQADLLHLHCIQFSEWVDLLGLHLWIWCNFPFVQISHQFCYTHTSIFWISKFESLNVWFNLILINLLIFSLFFNCHYLLLISD